MRLLGPPAAVAVLQVISVCGIQDICCASVRIHSKRTDGKAGDVQVRRINERCYCIGTLRPHLDAAGSREIDIPSGIR